jgi:hypothetical protein
VGRGGRERGTRIEGCIGREKWIKTKLVIDKERERERGG